MQAEAVQHSLASRIVQRPGEARKQLEGTPVRGQGSHGRIKHLPAICDLKKRHFDGGCGLLYGVSPFRISRLQVLKGRQKEAAWSANVQPLKVRHSD